MPSIRYSSLNTNSFLVITLYFLIIDSVLVNTIIVLLESTRLTILIKFRGIGYAIKRVGFK